MHMARNSSNRATSNCKQVVIPRSKVDGSQPSWASNLSRTHNCRRASNKARYLTIMPRRNTSVSSLSHPLSKKICSYPYGTSQLMQGDNLMHYSNIIQARNGLALKRQSIQLFKVLKSSKMPFWRSTCKFKTMQKLKHKPPTCKRNKSVSNLRQIKTYIKAIR